MELTLVTTGLLIALTCVSLQWIFKYFWLRSKLSSLPGPKSLPFIGISRDVINVPHEDRFQWFVDLNSKFKEGIVLTWIGVEPTVSIRKPWQVEIILRSNTLIRKSRIYEIFKSWLGNGLITSTGEQWFKHRKLITPAFHFGVLEEYAEVMREKVEILKDCIGQHLEKNPNMPVNIFEFSVRYTLDTICETAMGVDLDSQRKPDNTYVKALNDFGQLTGERYPRFWLKWDFIYYRTEKGKEHKTAIKVMHDFTEKVILQKQQQRREKISKKNTRDDEHDGIGKRKRKAFLDLLLDASDQSENSLTFQQIREEVDTFMFAGHDTTSAAISWALFLLGNSPDVQKKVHDELKEVFGNDTETATTKQLNQLKYMDRVIKETLRHYPSAPVFSRLLDHDVVIDGYTIPKGTILNISAYQLHHDSEVWEDPEKFDPDRFLPENSQGRHPYAFIPFSAGPRNCIGQKFALLEIKTVLTAILRKWRVSSIQKPSEVKKVLNIILRPHNKKLDIIFTPLD